MLGNLLISLRHRLPDFPGRQKLFRLFDVSLGPFVATTADGIRLQVFTSSFMDAHYFEPSAPDSSDLAILSKELDRLREGDVFVDIGANIGCFAIRAARRVGASGIVFAVEPSHREFTRLITNIDLNRGDNVVAICSALGAEPSIGTLHLAPTHTGLNTFRVADSTSHAFRGAVEKRVAVFRFDDVILPLLGEKPVQLLKIDVEGAEMDVFLGMKEVLRRGRVNTIVAEITHEFLTRFGYTKSDLFSFLASFGYRPRFRSEAWQYDEVFVRE